MRLEVRGIYSTALIVLLLDKGFEIINPTRSQVERFGVDSRGDADAGITDSSNDRHYIEVRGEPEVVEAVIEALRGSLDDLIVLRPVRGEKAAMARIGFPTEAKLKLDELRSRVAYTVPWHHYCRAGGEALSSMVSFAEDLVERGLMDPDEMSKMFDEQVRKMIPRLRAKIKIIHSKLDGKRIRIGPGTVIWRRDESVKIQRRILGCGVYDGLEVEKTPGDYALTEVRRLEWWMKTSYYNISGIPKGSYYNVCTPIALYPDHIHYFDLEVDVIVKPNGEAGMIDVEELERAVEEGRIQEDLMKRALRVADELLSRQP